MSNEVKEREVWATLRLTVDLNTKENRDKLFKAESLLREIGFGCDTGFGCGGRDWELDWSMKGAKLLFPRKVKAYTAATRVKEQ